MHVSALISELFVSTIQGEITPMTLRPFTETHCMWCTFLELEK